MTKWEYRWLYAHFLTEREFGDRRQREEWEVDGSVAGPGWIMSGDSGTRIELEDALNDLGRDGWELVGMHAETPGLTTAADQVYVFKRPIE